ncbi:MAG: DUF3795 domain-containing protein [candidate division WOR-3 bacterium]
MKNLAGRCGIYCGACEIYRAYKDKGKLLLEVARRHNCLPSEIRCEGCRAVHIIGWARAEGWGRDCNILKCLHRAKLETCAECPEISKCQRWNGLAQEYLSAGMDLRANLRQISTGAIDEWLRQQTERWRCQKCERPIALSTEDPRCHWCGAYQL